MGFFGRFRGLFHQETIKVRPKRTRVFVKQKVGRPKAGFKRDTIQAFRMNRKDKEQFNEACKRIEIKPSEILNNFCLTFIASILKARSNKDLAKLKEKISKITG